MYSTATNRTSDRFRQRISRAVGCVTTLLVTVAIATACQANPTVDQGVDPNVDQGDSDKPEASRAESQRPVVVAASDSQPAPVLADAGSAAGPPKPTAIQTPEQSAAKQSGSKQPATEQPATKPTETKPTKTKPSQTKPAAVPALDPATEKWLNKIESAAGKIKSLQARLVWNRIEGLRGGEQTRFGSLIYLTGPPARFAVHFEKLKYEDRGKPRFEKQNRWYVFDGTWLVEKLEDKKLFIKRQVGPLPGEKGEAERNNPLAMGDGPFVLPLDFNKKRITARFTVERLEVDAEDLDKSEAHLKNTIQLRLTPRPPRQIDFTVIDIWYDKDTALPLRVITEDKRENESIIDLHRTQLNEKVDEKLIDVSEPKSGWNVTVKPWEK